MNEVTMRSSAEEKIRLFRALFQGRSDVYARRWENTKTGKGGYSPACEVEWMRGVCAKPKCNCSTCANRRFLAISDQVVEQHLRGRDGRGKPFVLGCYPLQLDDTVKFAAIDFDKLSWRTDTMSVIGVLRELGLPVARERSRSGNGAHLWFFFETPVDARIVRDVLSFILSLTMERNPTMGLDSYDRIFPNQNRLPKGGFGNLIALPLQGVPRRIGNSVFVDDDLVPYSDQWKFLNDLPLVSMETLEELRTRACSERRILLPQRDEEIERNEPWSLFVSSNKKVTEVQERVDGPIALTLGNAIYIRQENLPPGLRGKLMRLAAFVNPAFHEAERMRIPIYNIPRVICCAVDGEGFLILPRGCLETVLQTLEDAGATWTIDDKRIMGISLSDVSFQGELRVEQRDAARALMKYDTGVLAAGTAFGKTVLAAWVIASRKVSTLVLVNRKPLMAQWVERLSQFLGIEKKAIGCWGGGRHTLTGRIDVALIQSLTRKGEVNGRIVGSYGQLIVDECHGISAPSFERVANAFAGKFVLGLSATVVRKDGHHPIIHMQCGPIRYRVDAKAMSVFEVFKHRVEVKVTGTFLNGLGNEGEGKPVYTRLVDELLHNESRNEMIARDVVSAIEEGRSPVVLTERREHLDILYSKLQGKVQHVLVLHGGMGVKQLKALEEKRASIPDSDARVLLATGSYLGEGFDDTRLDTLFLTLPISWKGRLTQYAGRLHRRHAGKREVRIYDYVDTNVELFARMFNKRCQGYKAIGYEVTMPVVSGSGLPENVSILHERKLDETYAESVRRLCREGVTAEEIDLFAFAAEQIANQNTGTEGVARSATEAFLFKHLDSLPQTAGQFKLNVRLDVPFGPNLYTEVDLLSETRHLAIEIDGPHHFKDRDAYRSDRRKDVLLQKQGYFVLRFLAEDVVGNLNEVMETILSVVKGAGTGVR